MNSEAVYARLTTILRDVFDDSDIVARADLTADDVEEWDSLSHLRLITSVQKNFGIKFSAAEISKLKNVGELAQLVEAKTV